MAKPRTITVEFTIEQFDALKLAGESRIDTRPGRGTKTQGDLAAAVMAMDSGRRKWELKWLPG